MKTIRKNDTVMVMSGKDAGKTGKILKIFPARARAVVQGINFVKKHTRRSRNDQQGGIVEVEGTIHLSNVMLYCSRCNKPTRPRFVVLKDGSKSRSCHACGENL